MTELPKLSRPAASAVKAAGIEDLEGVARLTRKEFLAMHGVGPASLPAVEAAFKRAGLAFAQE